jgi:phospholipid/cholesterol/gamma-HCH transport system permease protein
MTWMGNGSGAITLVGGQVQRAIEQLGDLSVFAAQTVSGLVRRRLRQLDLIPIFYSIGVLSVPVVALTGVFIGMVLAVQTYGEFHTIGLSSQLGAIINISIIRELGPVLAATMLAGRVGSAMAAELGTMRVTEQIDAIACLGVHPVHYLAGPRLLACIVLIPLLTVLADFMGVMGGAVICFEMFHIDPHYYWEHARAGIGLWDLNTSLVKSVFFGAAIGLISCHRGFNSRAGAEGVGRAATQAFVYSFIAILILDFFLVYFLNNLHDYLWPQAGARLY